MNPESEQLEGSDLREMFVVDSFHYKEATRTPIIIRMPHARLRPANCNMFEACFQTIITLLVSSKDPDLLGYLLPQNLSMVDSSIEKF